MQFGRLESLGNGPATLLFGARYKSTVKPVGPILTKHAEDLVASQGLGTIGGSSALASLNINPTFATTAVPTLTTGGIVLHQLIGRAIIYAYDGYTPKGYEHPYLKQLAYFDYEFEDLKTSLKQIEEEKKRVKQTLETIEANYNNELTQRDTLQHEIDTTSRKLEELQRKNGSTWVPETLKQKESLETELEHLQQQLQDKQSYLVTLKQLTDHARHRTQLKLATLEEEAFTTGETQRHSQVQKSFIEKKQAFQELNNKYQQQKKENVPAWKDLEQRYNALSVMVEELDKPQHSLRLSTPLFDYTAQSKALTQILTNLNSDWSIFKTNQLELTNWFAYETQILQKRQQDLAALPPASETAEAADPLELQRQRLSRRVEIQQTFVDCLQLQQTQNKLQTDSLETLLSDVKKLVEHRQSQLQKVTALESLLKQLITQT
jgi:hypothetical protein